MSVPEDAERSSRILALAQTLHKAAEAMEESNWLQCQRLAAEAARQARVIAMLEKEEKL